jgi:hypothetical protein
MVFNATFNNISIISWRSVLWVGEAVENHRPAAILYRVSVAEDGFELKTLV